MSKIRATGTAIAGSYLGTITTLRGRIICIFIILMCALISVVYNGYLVSVDNSRALSIESAKKQMKVYRDLFVSLPREFRHEAEDVNRIANSISENGSIPAMAWTFDENGARRLCQIVYDFLIDWIKSISENEDPRIDVLYVKKVVNPTQLPDCKNVIMVVAHSDLISEPPENFGVERDYNNDPYLDAQMFKKGKAQSVSGLTCDDVNSLLYYKNPNVEKGRYEQILFIPVMCESKKMVGLLEVLALKETKIAFTKKEMDKMEAKLRLFTGLFLLYQKTEKAATAVPPNSN